MGRLVRWLLGTRRLVCRLFDHRWSWREEGETVRRWVTIGGSVGHHCRRCGLDWRVYQKLR